MSTCRITDQGAFAKNGKPSILYDKLVQATSDIEAAKGLYAMTETEDFKTLVERPLKNMVIKERTEEASKKLVELFDRDNIPLTISEAKDMIKEVEDWSDWYEGLSDYVSNIFDEFSSDVLSLLPLASMGNGSEATVSLAINNVERVYKGENPAGLAEYYNFVSDFLEGKGIKSDKMYNFFEALLGDPSAIAVDMHVYSIIEWKDKNKKQKNPPNKQEFGRAKRFVNTLAIELGMQPREVQASLWALNKLRIGGKPDSYEEYFKKQIEQKGLKKRIEGWREQGYKPFSEVRKKRERIVQGSLDQNGEVDYKKVLSYAANLNSNQGTLNFVQELDLKDFMVSANLEDSSELFVNLRKAFYNDEGMFLPTRDSLMLSGLYSSYEASKILSDVELQKSIKDSVEALGNTSELENEALSVEQDFVEKTPVLNSWGKLGIKNPWVNKNEILETFVGYKNLEQELDLSDNPTVNKLMSKQDTRNELINLIDSLKKVPVSTENTNGDIEPLFVKNIKTQAVKLEDFSDITQDLEVFFQIDPSLYDSPESINYMESLEKKLAKAGLDFIGLSKKENFIEIIPAIQDFLTNPSKTNTDALESKYNEIFGLEEVREQEIVPDNTNYTLEKIYTNKSEQKMFEAGFIKTDTPNVYQKVKRIPFEEFKYFMFEQGLFGTIEEMETFLTEQSLNIKGSSNNDVAKEIVAYKTFFGHNIVQKEASTVSNSEVSNLYKSFQGNQEYLKGDFIADFYSDMLQEKATESDKYKNFYSNFDVTSKGLILKNSDPLSLSKIKTWLESGEIKRTEDIKNYSMLSKNMPALIEVEQNNDFLTKDDMRVVYSNNPNSLPLLDKNYKLLGDSSINIQNSSEDFVRTPKGVYELVYSKGNDNVYTPVLNSSEQNFYNFDSSQMFLEDNLSINKSEQESDYLNSVNKPSKADLDKINSDNFDCL